MKDLINRKPKTKVHRFLRLKCYLACTLSYAAILLAHSICQALPMPTQIESPQSKKSDMLRTIKEMQDRQQKVIETLDQNIVRTLQETEKIRINDKDVKTQIGQLDRTIDTIQTLKDKKQEHILRRQFLDRLTLIIDSKWSGQPLSTFLQQQILEMANTELTSGENSDNQTWKFASYLSIAIRELPEPSENLILFIEGYLNFSGLKEPKAPYLYLQERHYINPTTSQSAKTKSTEVAGDVAARAEKSFKMPAIMINKKIEQKTTAEKEL